MAKKKAARRSAKKATKPVKKSARKASTSTSRPAARKATKAKKAPARKAARRATNARTSAPTSARTKVASKKKVARKAGKAVANKAAARKVTKSATPARSARARKPVPAARKAPAKKAAGRKAAAPAKAKPIAAKKVVAAAKPVAAPKTRAATPALRRIANLDRPRRTVADIHGVPSSLDMDRTASSVRSGRAELEHQIHEQTNTSPALTAGDVDADWGGASAVGDEAPGGDNPTPDQDVVEEIGRALGVEYDDDEELQGGEEIAARDRHRWELDPESSDDFDER
jgi:hypothetical protein